MLYHILAEAALYLSPISREFSLGLHSKGTTPPNLKVVKVNAVPKPRRQIDSPFRVIVIKQIQYFFLINKHLKPVVPCNNFQAIPFVHFKSKWRKFKQLVPDLNFFIYFRQLHMVHELDSIDFRLFHDLMYIPNRCANTPSAIRVTP